MEQIQAEQSEFFLPRLWAAGSVVNAGSGNRMARFRQTILLRFSEENFKTHCLCIPSLKPVLKLARRRLFKGLLTRNVRAASYSA